MDKGPSDGVSLHKDDFPTMLPMASSHTKNEEWVPFWTDPLPRSNYSTLIQTSATEEEQKDNSSDLDCCEVFTLAIGSQWISDYFYRLVVSREGNGVGAIVDAILNTDKSDPSNSPCENTQLVQIENWQHLQNGIVHNDKRQSDDSSRGLCPLEQQSDRYLCISLP
jgi:hypothetical protein